MFFFLFLGVGVGGGIVDLLPRQQLWSCWDGHHLFFLGKLEQVVNQYFVRILSLVTDE